VDRALMDCLVLPIQTRVEEWKKITNVLDKEHHKGMDYDVYFINIDNCRQITFEDNS
jgi:hypothetical protein